MRPPAPRGPDREDGDHRPDAPALELRGVWAAYAPLGGFGAGAPWALEDVSFRVGAGEQVAVVGPNGAGKSTLLKLVTGLVAPERGEVRMFGRPTDEHDCIAYVPQRNQIDWSFPVTVEDVVMMGRTRQIGLFRRAGARDRAAVRAALERVGALALAPKQIGELSGGQQQRVFIARALALETHLLMLDEPLTGLDVPSQEALFEVLDTLRADRVTVLVATHDLALAGERFDRVMLLHRRVVAFGPPSVVLTPEHLIAAYGGGVRGAPPPPGDDGVGP